MTDNLAAFHNSLPAHIARWYTLDSTTIGLVKAATDVVEPAEMARIATLGITRRTDQSTARRVINYRLRRTAGLLNDDNQEAGA